MKGQSCSPARSGAVKISIRESMLRKGKTHLEHLLLPSSGKIVPVAIKVIDHLRLGHQAFDSMEENLFVERLQLYGLLHACSCSLLSPKYENMSKIQGSYTDKF